MHVNLLLIYNGGQVLRIFHLDARFLYLTRGYGIVLLDMKLKLNRKNKM